MGVPRRFTPPIATSGLDHITSTHANANASRHDTTGQEPNVIINDTKTSTGAEAGADASGEEDGIADTTPSTTPIEASSQEHVHPRFMPTKSQHTANILVSPTFLQTPRMDSHLDNEMDIDDRLMQPIATPGGKNDGDQEAGERDTSSTDTSSNSNGNGNANGNGNDQRNENAYKVNIHQLDGDIARLLKRLEAMEQVVLGSNDGNAHERVQMTKRELRTLLDAVKSTILRVNLKTTLAKNDLATANDESAMERYMLVRQLEDLQTTLRVIQTENDKITEKNLKLIKYVKTLKLEKLQACITENRQLKERIRRLEYELNVQRSSGPGQDTRPSADAMSINTPSSQPLGPSQSQSLAFSPPSTHMLDALGRLASEYLSHEQQ